MQSGIATMIKVVQKPTAYRTRGLHFITRHIKGKKADSCCSTVEEASGGGYVPVSESADHSLNSSGDTLYFMCSFVLLVGRLQAPL